MLKESLYTGTDRLKNTRPFGAQKMECDAFLFWLPLHLAACLTRVQETRHFGSRSEPAEPLPIRPSVSTRLPPDTLCRY